jgi:hypothetical protein
VRIVVLFTPAATIVIALLVAALISLAVGLLVIMLINVQNASKLREVVEDSRFHLCCLPMPLVSPCADCCHVPAISFELVAIPTFQVLTERECRFHSPRSSFGFI